MAARRKRKKETVLSFEDNFGGSFDRMITAMKDEYLDCRDMRHAWFKKGVKYLASEKCYERAMGCRRCGAEKTQLISSQTGDVMHVPGLGYGYHYPPNYIVKGVGRITAADNARIRLAAVVRAVK